MQLVLYSLAILLLVFNGVLSSSHNGQDVDRGGNITHTHSTSRSEYLLPPTDGYASTHTSMVHILGVSLSTIDHSLHSLTASSLKDQMLRTTTGVLLGFSSSHSIRKSTSHSHTQYVQETLQHSAPSSSRTMPTSRSSQDVGVIHTPSVTSSSFSTLIPESSNSPIQSRTVVSRSSQDIGVIFHTPSVTSLSFSTLIPESNIQSRTVVSQSSQDTGVIFRTPTVLSSSPLELVHESSGSLIQSTGATSSSFSSSSLTLTRNTPTKSTIVPSPFSTVLSETSVSSTFKTVGPDTMSSSLSSKASISTAPPTTPTTAPPTSASFNYKLILYVVPPLVVVVLIMVLIAICLCARRYRRIRRYRQHLVPLTDVDGSDDSDDDEELDTREPAFMIASTNLSSRPILSFDES